MYKRIQLILIILFSLSFAYGQMDCIEENLPNGFEQALPSSSPSASANQYVATDITVPEGMNFNLATLNAYLWVTGGMVVSAEIVVYADDDGVPDSDAIIAAFDEVLPSSQVELNAQFGYNYYDVSFEIPLTVLQGQSNLTTTYWISIYTSTTGTDGAWEMTSDSSVGNQIAYSLNFGSTWQISQNYDAVYNFEGECSFITSVEDYSLVEFEYYPNPAKDKTYLRFLFRGDVGERVEGELDQGIIAAEWLNYDEILACRAQHRSPMVLQCIEDFRDGPGYPLDIISKVFA